MRERRFTRRWRRLSRINTCVRLKSATGDSGFYEEISVETLCRAKWPLRFVPEIKNWKGRVERVTATKKRREEEVARAWRRWRRRRRGNGTTVTVHEKTNSVILFGRRAKPSVWRHIGPLSLISSPCFTPLLVSPPSTHPRRSRKLDFESTAMLKYKRQCAVSCHQTSSRIHEEENLVFSLVSFFFPHP